MRSCLFYCLVILIASLTISSPESLRSVFVSQFYDQCYDKYAFIHDYLELSRKKPQKYVIVHYHQDSVINGGVGDRFAGVISGFLHALRFGRLIFLNATNSMSRLFRPFHPSLFPDPRRPSTTSNYQGEDPLLDWADWEIWSGFRDWKASLPSPPLQLMLTHCHINPLPESGQQICGLDVLSGESDVEDSPIIRLTSNRALLCRYFKRTDLPSHKIILDTLKISLPLNDEESKRTGECLDAQSGEEQQERREREGAVDLFEIGGCILRLLMWPTEELWQMSDEFFQKAFEEYQKSFAGAGLALSFSFLRNSTPFTLQENPPYLMGIQYRCGDQFSFDGEEKKSICLEEESEEEYYFEREIEVGLLPYHFDYGRPRKIAECAAELLNFFQEITQSSESSQDQSFDSFFRFPHLPQSFRNHPLLVYVTSDTDIVEVLIRNSLNSNYPVILSANSCHIDVTPTNQCYEATVLSWFVLSLSSLMVVQTYNDEFRVPISAFSRYAGIYGLRDSPFRSGKFCGDVAFSNQIISFRQQGNWWCD